MMHNNEFVLLFLAFTGIFVFVLWCLSGNRSEAEHAVPQWLCPFLPMADVFGQDTGKYINRILPVYSSRIQKWCAEAGFNWNSQLVYGLQFTLGLIVLAVAGAVLFFLELPSWYAVAIAAFLALGAFWYPVLFIYQRAEKRIYEISRIMPFAIDLLCSSMSAGLDFVSSVRYYNSLNLTDPLSVEFTVLLREIELGKSRSDALLNMAKRVQCSEFDRFISAIVYSLESGTAIIDVMQLQADEVRRIRFARLEQQIAKVPSKMLVPIILCIVPSMFIMILVPLILSVRELGIFSALFE